MDRSAKYLKSLVGASGFEPEASCAQGRRSISPKASSFYSTAENPRLRIRAGCVQVWPDGSMWPQGSYKNGYIRHAQSNVHPVNNNSTNP